VSLDYYDKAPFPFNGDIRNAPAGRSPPGTGRIGSWPGRGGRLGCVGHRVLADGARVGRVVPGLRNARLDRRHRRGRGVPGSGVGVDHRAGQQVGLAAGAGRGRDRAGLPRDAQAPAPGPRRTVVAAAVSCGVRGHAALGPASLVLCDVSALYFETDAGDGFREPGFSKERRADRHGSRFIPSGRCQPSVAAIHLVLQIGRHGRAVFGLCGRRHR